MFKLFKVYERNAFDFKNFQVLLSHLLVLILKSKLNIYTELVFSFL